MLDWVQVAKSDESPAEPDDPRVDLSRCELWFRDERNRGGHYAGETALYRTPGDRWLFVSIYVDEFTRESSRHAWWPYDRQIEQAFLRHPEVEPPPDVAIRLEAYNATDVRVLPKVIASPEGTAAAPDAPAGGHEPEVATAGQHETTSLEQTCISLGGATVGIELVRFLWGCDGRRADLKTIAKEVQGKCKNGGEGGVKRFPTKGDRATARRLVDRTRQAMEEKDCPLRLVLSGNVARIVSRD